VLCTVLLHFSSSVGAAMALFILAYVFTNSGFLLFSSLLPIFTHERNVSTIVAMTVGVGYVGSLCSIVFFGSLVGSDEQARRVFLPMALIYLTLAFPVMFLGPDFARRSASAFSPAAAYSRLARTFREAKGHAVLFRFLVADFLYENAVASIIALMGLYSRNVMGFSARELSGLFGPAIIVAALSAWLLFGPLTRRLGPKRAVLTDLALWLLLFAALLLIGPDSRWSWGGWNVGPKILFSSVVAPLAGLALAGVWTTSRVMLTTLTPAERAGEFWGLYTMSGRTASVLGDATWSAILTLLGEHIFGYRVAIAALGGYVLLGAILVATLPDVRPSRRNFVA
jgi:UMF1 family MFS transporter